MCGLSFAVEELFIIVLLDVWTFLYQSTLHDAAWPCKFNILPSEGFTLSKTSLKNQWFSVFCPIDIMHTSFQTNSTTAS